MAAITGKNLYCKFGSTVLNTDYRSFGSAEDIGLVDASAGADTARTYLTTLTDGNAPLTILIQSADTTTWGAVVVGTEGTLEWGEEGTASGKMKHTVNAIVMSREKSMTYQDLVVADIRFQYSGAVSDSTY